MSNTLEQYKIIASYYDYIGDIYRARAYRKAIQDKSTHLRLISITDSNFKTYLELSRVVGAGPTTIRKWIADGITSLSKLRAAHRTGYKVTSMVAFGIKYYEDFLHPIPRSTVEKIAAIISKHLGNCVVVGSYRRGATMLKDIDILTLSTTPISTLPNVEMVTNGEQKQTIIYTLNKRAHRIDILRTNVLEAPTTLFYFTGSKDFNRRVRNIAKQAHLTLSEHGLFKGNKRIHVTSERDIFNKLGISYVPPSKRIA